MHCFTMQHTATYCIMELTFETCCLHPGGGKADILKEEKENAIMQEHDKVYIATQQHATTHCNALPRTATHCNALHNAARKKEK